MLYNQWDVEVSHAEIIHAIKYLKDKRSYGLNGISVEHLTYCRYVIIPLLFMCFSSLCERRGSGIGHRTLD